jgi:hypothetical protein
LIFDEASIFSHCLKVHCTKGQVGDTLLGEDRCGYVEAMSGRRRNGIVDLDFLDCEAFRLVAVQVVGLIIALRVQFNSARGRSGCDPGAIMAIQSYLNRF